MLRDADDLLAPAVEETLAALELVDADAALVRLARSYAAAIDDAAVLADALDGMPRDDEDIERLVRVLEAKVRAQTVLETFGPKLLAALSALGATPAARGKRKGGGGDRAGENRLQALRAARR